MIVITVARKPLSEGTVTANVLKHATGALNVDACRVRSSTGASGSGRWPPNVILSHLDACVCRGTRTVRSSSGTVAEYHRRVVARTGGIYGDAEGGGTTIACHVAADGTETVDLWDCAPGCPVAELDAGQECGPSRFFVRVGVSR